MVAYDILSISLSIVAIIMALCSIVSVIVIKVYYIDKINALNGKIDPYDKYRNADGLLTKSAINKKDGKKL